jgi:hypothetical protein
MFGGRSFIRLLALIVCLLFTAAVLFAAGSVLFGAHHVHNHSGANGSCTICSCAQAAKELLKSITALAAAVVIAALCRVLLGTIALIKQSLELPSLVALKVRLDF